MPNSLSLRERILKESLVRSEIAKWEKTDGEPVKVTNQPIVEIGIDDLLSVIEAVVPKSKNWLNKSTFSKGTRQFTSRDEAMFDQGYNQCRDDFLEAIRGKK